MQDGYLDETSPRARLALRGVRWRSKHLLEAKLRPDRGRAAIATVYGISPRVRFDPDSQ
jgi:hypothetical protein